MTNQRKPKKALSVADVLSYKPKTIPFEGKWRDAIGLPELKGSWLIYGDSGMGKTSFAMQLGRYLCSINESLWFRTAYDSIEEGLSSSIQEAYKRTGMANVARRFLLLDKESIEDLQIRLKERRSPDVIFIDSVQYAELTRKTYKELVDMFGAKLFIFISHADGDKPKGALAQSIYYDANVCIYVHGFVANVTKSRYGGSGEIVVSESKRQEFWSIKQ
ncbi:MAG TPA: ATP-binding protein [Dysgonomonas sp.]|uniref:ATP-binding protein n=1 Tax=unclassified Dysgonomonas TaxID=2630389 RepID=UPI0025B8A215|nr:MULTISPECIES: ATP-binding protein [unclassified Dysgonomonas]HML64673.1 ATP-binding protein [Dysgonomonas sp.]